MDNGIAEVEKLYDAVVVVESFKNDKLVSSGTGFVYKTEGNKAYIITNAHVVTNATKVEVMFTNHKSYEVKLVGQDVYADIAVLSIDKDKITSVAKLGSSEKARLEIRYLQSVPSDSEYSWTVTRGILSGKDV